MEEIAFNVLLRVLPIASIGAAVAGAFTTIVATMLALRAKRRAQELLLSSYKDQLIRFGLKDRSAESLTTEEVERISRMIEDAISSLSKSDKHLIEQGLNQSSSAAVKNYIRDVATAA
jgi:hypothetical protein